MKKSRFSDRQIIAILKQGDSGIPVAQLCREHGLSAVSYYKWCAKYGGLDAPMISTMKSTEEEPRSICEAAQQVVSRTGFWLAQT
ncbi:Transposase [Pseudovibrio sp. W64]|nr:Transposase [Pseudovibrio sp. Ad13]KZK85835.1 Transposase [Pseudovibrio sp. W64]